MKLLLCTIIFVYLLQAYRLARLLHREAEGVAVNDIITEIPNLLKYVRNTTITKLSKDAIQN